jgi:hypothetical protein
VTITITISPDQWANVKDLMTASNLVPSNAHMTADLFDFVCPGPGSGMPNPKLAGLAGNGVVFRLQLSAKKVAHLNKTIRGGHCGKIHTVQQDYQTAYAQWAGSNKPSTQHATAAPTTTTRAPTTSTVPIRKVVGSATTLGAGNFTSGTDVPVGLYDVTTGPGQSGNFIVQGTDSYDEILDSSGMNGVPKVRAQISTGDQIQISGLSRVTFTPVSTPLVTTHRHVTLYAGTWTVGQDLGPGRYVATPGAGQNGNFIIDSEGVNEILGSDITSGDVPSVTFSVQDGDVVNISGLSQVTLTPS